MAIYGFLIDLKEFYSLMRQQHFMSFLGDSSVLLLLFDRAVETANTIMDKIYWEKTQFSY